MTLAPSVAGDPVLEMAAAYALARRKARSLDALAWTERYRVLSGGPMRIPHPLRAIYQDTSERLVLMKGAQLGFSEYAIGLCLWTADTGRAGRGTSLYVQPSGGDVGDFVQGRVNPAIDNSPYIEGRMRSLGREHAGTGPDKVGLKRVGEGYTYWRTARSRSGLKSVPADTVVLDEYDEMPEGTIDLVSHRMDSSESPMLVIISTPTYPGVGVEEEYLAGTRMRYEIECPGCEAWQVLDWERNVEDGERVCASPSCRASLEEAIGLAWRHEATRPGRWRAERPDASYPSYHLSQLYRPEADLAAISDGLASSNQTTLQETWNQNLGLPFSPPGGQLSREEVERICDAPYTLPGIAGVQGCWMGVDVGTRLHVWIMRDHDYGDGARRYLVGSCEVDRFEEVAGLMDRFGVITCVVDAGPELRAVQQFALSQPGRVWPCEYVLGRMPPLLLDVDQADPKRRWHVQVDRTAAMDAIAGQIRSGEWSFPADALSVPGLVAMLQAPVRRLVDRPDGSKRAVYDEGSRADHYYHAAVYCELASYVGEHQVQQVTRVDARGPVGLGAWERG